MNSSTWRLTHGYTTPVRMRLLNDELYLDPEIFRYIASTILLKVSHSLV
jgi:hypothetical protein